MEYESKKTNMKNRTMKHHLATATAMAANTAATTTTVAYGISTQELCIAYSIPPVVCWCFYYTRAWQSKHITKYLKCDEYIYTAG